MKRLLALLMHRRTSFMFNMFSEFIKEGYIINLFLLKRVITIF